MRCLSRCVVILLTAIASYVQASDSFPSVSAIVHGVDLLNGRAQMRSVDIVGQGIEPVALIRSFDLPSSTPLAHWCPLPQVEATVERDVSNRPYRISTVDGSGRQIVFVNDGGSRNFHVDISQSSACAMDGFSARESLRLHQVTFEGDHLKVTLADGTVRRYTKASHSQIMDHTCLQLGDRMESLPEIWLLTDERRPSGNSLRARYFSNGCLQYIELLDCKQNVFSTISFNQRSTLPKLGKDWNGPELVQSWVNNLHHHNKTLSIKLGDGREVSYGLLAHPVPMGKRCYLPVKLPSSVTGWGISGQVMLYEPMSTKVGKQQRLVPQLLSAVCSRDGSQRIYKYNEEGKVAEVQLRSTEGASFKLCAFKYGRTSDGSAETVIYPSTGGWQRYIFSAQGLMRECSIFDQDGVLLRRDEWRWSKDKPARLIGHAIFDNSRQCLKSEGFAYDALGNVVQSTLHGPITGNFAGWDRSQAVPACSEQQQIRYSYNTRNLLVRRDGPGSRFSISLWEPKRDLCIGELSGADGVIISRTFYERDDAGCIIKEHRDNGSSDDPTSTAGVTWTVETEYEICHLQHGLHQPSKAITYAVANSGGRQLLAWLEFKYDEAGQVAEHIVKGQDGKVLYSKKMAYSEGLPLQELNSVGSVTSYTYDSMRRITATQGPCGEHTKYAYDSWGHLSSVQLIKDKKPAQVTKYSYSPEGLLETVTSPEGWATSYRYDVLGREICSQAMTEHISALAALRNRPIGKMSWEAHPLAPLPINKKLDALGRTVEVDGPIGKTKAFYNVFDQPLKEIQIDGRVKTWRYNLYGDLLDEVNEAGVAIHYDRDSLGRLIKKSCEDSVEIYRYHRDQLVQQVDGLGREFRLEYDQAGRVVAQNYCGRRREILRDAMQREVGWKQDAMRELTELDSEGRVLCEQSFFEDQLQSRTRYEYDASSRVLAQHLDLGDKQATTRYSYDELGRLIAQETPLGTVTTYSYKVDFPTIFSRPKAAKGCDNINCAVMLEHLPGGLTKETYSCRGSNSPWLRCLRQGSKVLWEELYQYTPSGLICRMQRRGEGCPTLQYEWMYTREARVEREVLFVEHGCADVTRYEYDDSGMLSCEHLPDGRSIRRYYDKQKRLIGQQASDGSVSCIAKYDGGGRLVCWDSRGKRCERTYDNFDQLCREQLPSGHVINHQYDQYGNLISTRLPSGRELCWHYRGRRLYGMDIKDPSGTCLHQVSVKQNMGGQVTELHTSKNTTLVSYDLLGRPAALQHPHFSDSTAELTVHGMPSKRIRNKEERQYRYDALGTLVGEADVEYKVNSLGSRVGLQGSNFEMDKMGRPVWVQGALITWSKQGTIEKVREADHEISCSWDVLGRLQRLEQHNMVLQRIYDPFDRLITEHHADESLDYLYSGRHQLGFIDKNGNETIRLMLPQESETGATVAIVDQDGVHEVVCDLQGSIAWVADKGSVTYSAFGESRLRLCNWGYRSKGYVPGTDWVDFGRRIYAPSWGIFLSPDPKGLSEGWWRHHYCNHSPLGVCDPWGEEPIIVGDELNDDAPSIKAIISSKTPFELLNKSLDLLIHTQGHLYFPFFRNLHVSTWMYFPDDRTDRLGPLDNLSLSRVLDVFPEADIVLYGNGISTTSQTFSQTCARLCGTSDRPCIVLGARRPPKPKLFEFRDVLIDSILAALVGKGSPEGNICMAEIARQFTMAGSKLDGRRIYLVTHSGGAMAINSAAKALKPWQDSISVFAVNPGCPVAVGGWKSVLSMRNPNDEVALWSLAQERICKLFRGKCAETYWTPTRTGECPHSLHSDCNWNILNLCLEHVHNPNREHKFVRATRLK